MVDALFGRMGRVLAGESTGNGRSLAYVWGFGSTCLTATLLLNHPSAANDRGLALIAVIGYLGAAVLFVRADTLPQMALEVFTYFGQVLITVLALLWGAPEAPFLWFHVWLVVHSFHFLAPSRAARQIACAAGLFVFSTLQMDNRYPAATIVVGVGTITAVGMIVGAFRARVDELLEAAARNAALDPLTELLNRRAFADAYAAEQRRRARYGGTGALIVVDCDQFKALNDGQGHRAGDNALRRVAECIATNVRDVDAPARLGGDEFAVLLSAPEPGTAAQIGRRIQQSVHAREDLVLTLSVGVVELPPGVSVDVVTALEAADRAMYEAKHEGGDRVAVGTLPPEAVAGAAPDGAARNYAAA